MRTVCSACGGKKKVMGTKDLINCKRCHGKGMVGQRNYTYMLVGVNQGSLSTKHFDTLEKYLVAKPRHMRWLNLRGYRITRGGYKAEWDLQCNKCGNFILEADKTNCKNCGDKINEHDMVNSGSSRSSSPMESNPRVISKIYQSIY